MWILSVPANAEIALAQALSANPNVRFAEPDFIRTFGTQLCALCAVSGDAYMGYKWDLQNHGTITNDQGAVLAATGQAGADLNWTPAFEALGADFGGSVVVAILDSGIRADHEDLVGRVVGGRNFYSTNDSLNWADDNGHGTHVTGIIGSRAGNGTGIAGLAWGPNVQFLAVKVCGLNLFWYTCTDSAIYQGINWAVAQGASVLNLSLGGASSSQTVQTALQNAVDNDVLPVCAAGNGGQATVSYPGAFPECMAVSATDWSDELASYSNRGTEIEVAAPGGDVENASGYSYILSSYNSGPSDYAFMAGTSMAAPQVTGLAALLFAQGLSNAQDVRERIRATADDLGPPGWDPSFGFGRVNAGQAITSLGGPPPPPPGNQAPIASFTHSCVALLCDFTDTSFDVDGDISEWAWDFGDGSTSGLQNPSHEFASEANYAVTLVVTDDDDATGQTSSSVNLVPAPETVVAQFSVQCDGLTCQFTNESYHQDGVNLLADWDFGDGSSVVVAWSPTHAFAAPGDYEAILVVLAEDLSGWSSTRQWITVSEAPPPPSISLSLVGYRVKGRHQVDLTWSGATSDDVVVLREGQVVSVVVNDSGEGATNVWTHATTDRGGGTWTYQICEADGAGNPAQACSAEAQVQF